MKEFNFNTLRDLPVPENWIENALSIPEQEEQRPAAVPFWRKPRFIAMAASMVLVSALSIALFLTMGTKPPVAVKSNSKSSATQIVWSTDEYGATVATEVVVVPDDSAQRDGTSPTEAKSGIVRFLERLFGGDDNTAPTTATDSGRSGRMTPTTRTYPSAGGRTTPTGKPAPTEGGRPSPTAKTLPTEAPTEDDTSVIIHGPGGWDYEKPTEPPTESPTEGSWVPPTSAPWETPTEPTWEDPTQSPVPKPTESRYKASVSVTVSGWAVSSINQDGGVVYCRIYDDNGNMYGDSDRYSDQHLATLTLGNIYRTLSYTPRDYGILPEDGLYRFEFYTRSGNSLVTGSAYLSAT